MAILKLKEEYLTVSAAAKRKGVSRTAIYQAIERGSIPHARVTGGTILLSARDVDTYKPNERRKPHPPKDKRPIWEKIAELGRQIPPEEWAKVPRDASINIEHYLYGAPKVED